MPLKLSNNAIGTLVSSMTASDTSVVLAPGQGAKFPAINVGEWFPITVIRASEPTQFEIMHVTARSGDVLTVTRAREGTVAITFSVGDIVEHRLTKDALDRDFVRLGPDSLDGVRVSVADDGSDLKTTVHANDKEEQLARQKDIDALGTAATKDTGTGPDEVPTNSDLGTAATRDVGTGANEVPANSNLGAAAYLPIATTSQAQELTNDATVITPKKLGDVLGPEFTAPADLTGSNNLIYMSGIVPALGLEVGDVIQLIGGGDNDSRLHTVEVITDDNTIVVNYEHCGSRGDGSLKLFNYSGSLTVKRISKWFNAPIGLGQAWVRLTERASGVTYTKPKQMRLGLYVLGESASTEYNIKLVIDGYTVFERVDNHLPLQYVEIPIGAETYSFTFYTVRSPQIAELR